MSRFLKGKEEYTPAHKEELARYKANSYNYIGEGSMSIEAHDRISKNLMKEFRLGVYEIGDAYSLGLVSNEDNGGDLKLMDSSTLYNEQKEKLAVGLCLKCEKANDRKDHDECICSSCKAKAFGK